MNPTPINVNGYDTYYCESQDDLGKHLLIAIPPEANHSISDICGTFVANHYINQIDYAKVNGIRFIKAYF